MVRPLAQEPDADRALCALADHHRGPDGDPAIGRRLRVHGAALEHGDTPALGRGDPGHCGADRRLSKLSARSRSRCDPAHRPGAAFAGGRFPARNRPAAARRQAVLLPARSGALGRDQPADRQAVLDRHGRTLGAGRDPHQARRCGDAGVRTAQRRLRVELGNFPAVDGRHVAGAARRRHPVPAQPDPPDPLVVRSGRKLRQGPRGAGLPAARRARGAPRLSGFHRDSSSSLH